MHTEGEGGKEAKMHGDMKRHQSKRDEAKAKGVGAIVQRRQQHWREKKQSRALMAKSELEQRGRHHGPSENAIMGRRSASAACNTC